jgi:hypothetical protein
MKLPETIKFKVTRADLKHAYNDPTNCPIAQAARRNLPPGFNDVRVFADSVAYFRQGAWRLEDWYHLRKKDNRKARSRSGFHSLSLSNIILGGFTVVLTKK